jgi:hypothetical protein
LPARLLILVLAALLAVVPAACGGDRDEDVDTILRETFTGDKQVDSGRLALSVSFDARDGEHAQDPVSIELAGPFQRRGEDELPSFDLDATLTGAGMTYEAGAVSTGDAGFVVFQGQEYALSREIFDRFRDGFREGREEKGGDEADADLATLGVDPRKWLTDARNAGDAEVGDTGTTRITGDVDVPRLLEDLAQAGERARELDRDNRAGLPSELTQKQSRQIDEAVERMSVEIFTGEEDRILRRIVLDADVRAPERGDQLEAGKLRLDYSITELNQDQQIEEPENPRPFAELERQLSRLGIGGPSGDSRASRGELRRYTRCVERAGSDRAAVRECAKLL